MLDEGLATSAVDYADALAHWREFRRRVDEAFDFPKRIDALIMPATDTTAPASLDTTGNSKFQAPWSYSGLPVVSIPCGLASDGMPAAVQLVGRLLYDFPLLGIAQWCEAQLGFDELPPLVR
jgi:aspartyl-tRNA(Asn)/glutamyl-tRNA(Gln) amidotransferase subunit A